MSVSGGDPGIILSGGSINTAGGTCSFSIQVTSATPGIYNNTTSGVTSNESAPAGPVSNTASLTVMNPPTVNKSFSPSTIGKGQTSTLTITLNNTNDEPITGVSFTDNFPANITAAPTPNLSITCSAGVDSYTSGSVSLAGATVPAGSNCTVSIDITSNTVNLTGYTNTIGTGAVTSTNAGSNASPASATLIVNDTPTLIKSFVFNPATGISTMNISITNNSAATITGVSFTDLFPVGMKTDNPPSVTPATPCGAGSSIQSWDGTIAGTLSPTGGDNGIQLTAGQLAAGASCSFGINLTVNALGVYNNQTSGATGSFAGTGSPSNSASWIAPRVEKTFNPVQVTPTTLGPSDISRMALTITNPSLTTTLTGLSISDTYPTSATKIAGGTLAAALTSPSVPAESNTCGGTVTATSTGISLTGGTLAPGASCVVSVDVYATDPTPAAYLNVTGKVGSDQGVGLSASNTLIITSKPTIDKSFLNNPVTLTAGSADSVMRIVIDNNFGADITNLSFSDTFPTSPSQMVWKNTVSNTCGGTLTDTAGAALVSGTSTGIKLTGGAITAVAVTCTIDVTVTVTAAGSYSNITSGATSSANAEVGPVSNTAILSVQLSAPTASKSFAASGFQINGTNTLTITLTNPNTVPITGAAFTDTYPASMVNAPSPGVTNTCSGTVTAAAGANTLSLSGGVIPASGSCVLTVQITTTAEGAYTNTLTAGAVISDKAKAGPATDIYSSTTAYLPPTLSKTFGDAALASGGTTSLILTLTNPATNPATLTSLQVDDTFPAGLTLADTVFTFIPAACGSVTSTVPAASTTGDDNIRLSVASLAAGSSCEVSVNVTSSTNGAITNTTGNPTASSPAILTGIAAWADLTISNMPNITIVHSVIPANAKPGDILYYTATVYNFGGPAGVDSIVVTDPVSLFTTMYVNDLAGPGSGPLTFTQGTPSSTLSYTYPTDFLYSNDNGLTWTATPVADANGCDISNPPITHFRINPKGTFIGGSPAPNFIIHFRACVK